MHDTVGIIFQDMVDSAQCDSTNDPPQDSENIAENTADSETVAQNAGSSESFKKRRRTFDAITFELEPYNKKPKFHDRAR